MKIKLSLLVLVCCILASGTAIRFRLRSKRSDLIGPISAPFRGQSMREMVRQFFGRLDVPEIELSKYAEVSNFSDLLGLVRKDAVAHGADAVVQLPDQFLKSTNRGVVEPALFLESSGPVWLIAATFEVGGESYVQFIRDDGLPLLVPERVFRESASRIIVLKGGRVGLGQKFGIGQGSISVDKTVQNFGLVKPYGDVHASFKLTNSGSTILEIPSILASTCGCTVGKVKGAEQVFPGESRIIEASVHASRDPFRQSLMATVLDRLSGERKSLKFDLTGSISPSMEVSPETLDFGRFKRGETSVRELRLSEIAGDRFQIKRIDPGGWDVTTELVDASQDKAGLSTYRYTLKLGSDSLNAGECSSNLKILTDSKLRPVVEIPMKAFVDEDVYCVPSKIYFGTVGDGDRTKKGLIIVVPGNAPYRLRVLDMPPGFDASIVGDEERPKLEIGLAMGANGLRSGKLVVEVRYGNNLRTLNVDCVGFVN